MFHTPQSSKYETLGASVDTKINMLMWTNSMKTRVNLRGTITARKIISRPTMFLSEQREYTEELYHAEELHPRNSIIPRYSKHSEELLINEQLRRSELHLGRVINYQTDNCSTIH